IHTSGPWADETEKDIVRHQNKYQPSQFDAILIQINNVSQQLADIYNNLAFTLTRINMIEASAFAHKTDTLLTSCQLATLEKHKLKSKQALNFYWDLIQGCIIKATENLKNLKSFLRKHLYPITFLCNDPIFMTKQLKLQSLISTLTVIAKTEEEEHKSKSIRLALEQHCNNFLTNQTK
ncbi:9760_t:CDS:2, partial [Funneliformis geosporum]